MQKGILLSQVTDQETQLKDLRPLQQQINFTTWFKRTQMCWSATHLIRCSNNYTRLLDLCIPESCIHVKKEQLIHVSSPLNTMVQMHISFIANPPSAYNPEEVITQMVPWEIWIQRDWPVKRKLRNQSIYLATPNFYEMKHRH